MEKLLEDEQKEIQRRKSLKDEKKAKAWALNKEMEEYKAK